VHTAGGTTYRNKAMQMSGKSQFPFLVDSNTGMSCPDLRADAAADTPCSCRPCLQPCCRSKVKLRKCCSLLSVCRRAADAGER
jgi:hypothetical protein